MKRLTLKLFIAIIFMLVFSSSLLLAENEKLKVFVSILPQKYFAERLLGENGTVEVLIGPGMSPHTYEPLPQQMGKLSRSDVFFTIGIPFEKVIVSRLKNLCPKLFIIHTDENIEKIPMIEHDHDDGDCHHDEHEHNLGLDPHFWLDPLKAFTMAENMAKAIASIRPDLTQTLNSNLEIIKTDIISLDEELTKKMLSFKGQTLLVFHPAFGYFAKKYGMVQKAVEIEGKEPAPRQLGELIRNCRAEGVKVIFVQKQFPVSTAKTIANSIGGSVVAIDPLAEDYLANLKTIADAIANSAN